MTPTVYVSSRCHAFWGVWIYQNACVLVPALWNVERRALGVYRITPNPADIPDTARALPIANIFGSVDDIAPGGPNKPDARTLVIGYAPGYYEVGILNVQGDPIDGSFTFLLLSPD